MAQLQNVTIEAVGFAGLNTQDAPAAIDPSFAAVAENCVIDKYGRIAARKGHVAVSTTTNTALRTDAGDEDTLQPIETLYNYTDRDGNETLLSAGNKKIFSGTNILTDITPDGYTITDNNWKVVTLQNHAYLFQLEHEPLVFAKENGTYELDAFSDHASATGTPPNANEVLSAYGRLWAAGTASNKHTVYWSDLLNGHAWTGGTSGSLDLSTVWPTGYDEIVALAAHNGFLVIFGKNSIVVYSGATSPASMTLADTVTGVGCISRDTVQNTGTDIIFLSDDGLRTFGRTIQEKSMPIGNLSKNVHDTFMTDVRGFPQEPAKAIYSPDEGFYVISFPQKGITYCFSIQELLPDESAKVTTWTDVTGYSYAIKNNSLLIGRHNGIYKYSGYMDIEIGEDSYLSYYVMKYKSNPMDFGQPSNLKFVKKFEITAVGNSFQSNSGVVWYYDYDESSEFIGTYPAPDLEASACQYEETGNVTQNEYENVGTVGTTVFEYTDGVIVHTPSVQGEGSGQVLTAGVQVLVFGAPYSIQKLGIHATLGRLA